MMLKTHTRLLIISVLMVLGAPVNAEFDEASMTKKINQLVSKMTLEEKALLTSGRDAWSTQPIERLDIPYIWMADGHMAFVEHQQPTYGAMVIRRLPPVSQQHRHYRHPGIWNY